MSLARENPDHRSGLSTDGNDKKANIYREISKDCRYWEDQFKTPPKSEEIGEINNIITKILKKKRKPLYW